MKISRVEINEELQEQVNAAGLKNTLSIGRIAGLTEECLPIQSGPLSNAEKTIGGLSNDSRVVILGQKQNGYVLVKTYCQKDNWNSSEGWQIGWIDEKFIQPV